MAKRQSILEDLIGIAARLPWWANVLLALVSYVGMHMLAGMEIATPKGIQGLGNTLMQSAVRTFGIFAQYLLPIVFLI